MGNVLHTGDWKIDHDPRVGRPIDMKRLAEISAEGVDAMICDFHQCRPARAQPVGRRGRPWAGRGGCQGEEARRRHHFRLEPRPYPLHRRGRRQERPGDRGGGPGHQARSRRCGRTRHARGATVVPRRGRLWLSAARQGDGHRDRQPGRGARRPCQDRGRRPSQHHA